MNTWRKLTENDLIAVLSRSELNAYRNDFEVDAVAALLTNTASWVRGYIRTNGNVKLSPDESEIPASCVSPAMDYAAFRILKRIDRKPNEARTNAYNDAIEYFKDVAAGRVNPESYSSSSATPTGGSCAVVVENARTRVSASKLEGL